MIPAKLKGVLLCASIICFSIGCAEVAVQPPRILDAKPQSGVNANATLPVEPIPATTQSADAAWPLISREIERVGVLKDDVYTIVVPRDDLDVTIEGMGIPTAAGIESVFHFYRCPCGKMNVAGEFVTTNYESNDVVDALRQNATMKVAAVAPLLLYEKPQLTLIRFQGEGDPVAIAKVLREALRWTGRERMAPSENVIFDSKKSPR